MVNARCSKRSKILFLTKKIMNRLRNENSQLDRNILQSVNRVYKRNNRLIIDVTKTPIYQKSEINLRAQMRQQCLKNVVIQVINSNRIEKQKPTFRNIIEFFKDKGLNVDM